MTTEWTLPTTIIQYAEPGGEDAHVSWLDNNDFNSLKSLDGKSVRTSRDLFHTAREPRHDLTDKTYYLQLSSFNFTRSAQDRNAENVLIILDDPIIAKKYIANWERRAAVSRNIKE